MRLFSCQKSHDSQMGLTIFAYVSSSHPSPKKSHAATKLKATLALFRQCETRVWCCRPFILHSLPEQALSNPKSTRWHCCNKQAGYGPVDY